VGTEATIVIISTGRTLGGDYRLWWGYWIDKPAETNFELLRGTAETGTYEVVIHFIVPEVPYKPGNYFITFYNPRVNPKGAAATILFKVEPGVEASPSSSLPGSTVSIKGTAFPANDDSIQLSFDGKATNIEIATNGLGSFTAEFTIPDTIAGNHSFKANSAEMYITKPPTASLKVVPIIGLEPEFPEIGKEVTITGHGFAASSLVTIEYDGTAVANSPTTDEVGNFTHTFNIPENSESKHSVVATDGAGNEATFGMSLEGEAPPAPATISPTAQRFGWLGSQLVLFNWTKVTDISGVTYTLEIADNLNFFPLAPRMRKTGLSQPTCLVNIEPGTYYWRVKAVDGAGNESEWTLSPQPFKVGFFSTLYLVIGGFICIIIIVFVIRGFSRRVSEYY